MRSRWYHLPRLHTASHHGPKKVSWLELFYDLIFVASIIQLGDFLAEDVSLSGFAEFAGHFVPLWIAWSGFTFFQNRFDIDDLGHRAMVLAQMFALGAMATSSRAAMNGDHEMFAGAYAFAQALIVAMHVRAWAQVPEAQEYARYWGGVFMVGAMCFGASVMVPNPYCYALWVVGIGAILFAPIASASRRLQEALPIDQEHLSERYGLLTIIVLGESFVKVLTFLSMTQHGSEAEYILKGFFNLTITVCLWWIYFDDVAGSTIKKGRGTWVIWLYGHLPLTLAITAVGVAVKKATEFELHLVARDEYRWLLGGCLALALLSVALVDSVTERRNAMLSDRTRVMVRTMSALVVLLLAQVGSSMSAGALLGIMAAVCMAQVLFDMTMAPLEETEDTHHAQTTAELDAQRKEQADSRLRVDVANAVRKGAPTALRRDLYFFFIEGSWTRLLLSFGFLYLMLNILFAAMYQLEPGSIQGDTDQSFADAFFFSVQTLASLGYGAINPATTWADVVVTVEAAIGMLFVALATGLMFAKASHPQAAVLFADKMIVMVRNDVPTLMFRVANARGNEVVDAAMSVNVLVTDVSPEGHHMRRLVDLKLERSRSPLFTLSWLCFHIIDESSPLYGLDLNHDIQGIICTMTGHDGTYGSTTYARHLYYPEAIMVGHRYVDVVSELEDGRLLLDLTKFDDVVAEGSQP